MKKNKWLSLLAVITLLTTCLFAGLASAAIPESQKVSTLVLFPTSNPSENNGVKNFDFDLGVGYSTQTIAVKYVAAPTASVIKTLKTGGEASTINYCGYNVWNDDVNHVVHADPVNAKYKWTTSNKSIIAFTGAEADGTLKAASDAVLEIVNDNITKDTVVTITMTQVEDDGTAVPGAPTFSWTITLKINPIKGIKLISNIKDDKITLNADGEYSFKSKDTGKLPDATDETAPLSLRDLVTVVLDPLSGTYNDTDDLSYELIEFTGSVKKWSLVLNDFFKKHAYHGEIEEFLKVEGTATFTVKVTDQYHGSNVSGTYTFTVKGPDHVYDENPVIALDFVTNPIIVEEGAADFSLVPYLRYTLKDKTSTMAPAADDRNLWISSKSSVAQVEKTTGWVDVGNVGEATITVQLTNYDKEKTAVKTTVVVKVVAPGAQAIILDKDVYDLKICTPVATTTAVATVYGLSLEDINFASDAPNIFTVDAATGEMTPKAVGSGTLTAFSISDPTVKTTAKVNVTWNDLKSIKVVDPSTGKEVESATLSFTSTTNSDYGETYNVNLIRNPSDCAVTDIKWTSSNAKVATVDYNSLQWATITATGVGTCDITVTISDGKTELTKTIKVTVVSDGSDPKPTEPTGKVLITELKTAKSITLKAGQKKQISVERIPKNATNKELKFKSNKTSVVTVGSNGKLYAKRKGNATITISAKDGSGVKVKVKVKVK